MKHEQSQAENNGTDGVSTPAARSALAWLREHAPTPTNSHEAVALAVHALLLHHNFRPAGTAAPDDAELEPAATPANTAAAAPTTVTTAAAPATLPSGWGGAGFGGQYRHVRSAMLFDIRAVRMGGRLVVHAAAGEDDSRMYTVDVRVADYTSETDLPGQQVAGATWHNLTRIDALATLVAVQIAHRLVPDGAKAGYENNPVVTGQSSQAHQAAPSPQPRPDLREPQRTDPNYDPLRIGPIRQPRMPAVPFGADDLVPPGFPGPGGMFQPGGNLMGPGHFMAGDRRMPPGVPPGARFDPYGPVPDPDMELAPGFDDDHGLRGGQPSGGFGRGGRAPSRGRGGGGFGGGGFGDDGPPPGMFF